MIPLLVLTFVLLALWAYGVLARAGSAAFMERWRNVPLFAAILTLLLAIGAAIKN